MRFIHTLYYVLSTIILINRDCSLNNINQPERVAVFVYFKVETEFKKLSGFQASQFQQASFDIMSCNFVRKHCDKINNIIDM